MNESIESIYDEYRPLYRPIPSKSEETAYGLRPKWNQKESAYVSRKRMWRTSRTTVNRKITKDSHSKNKERFLSRMSGSKLITANSGPKEIVSKVKYKPVWPVGVEVDISFISPTSCLKLQ